MTEKVLSIKKLSNFQTEHDQSGVVYMSRVPPHMKPIKVKQLLSKFGQIGRIYLKAEDDKKLEARKKKGGSKKKQFLEGWIEFKDKKIAKAISESLNNTPMAQKKGNFYHDDLWNLKYLDGFKWVHLKEQIAYERIERQKKIQLEMEKAKKEVSIYIKNVDKYKMKKAIEEKKLKKSDLDKQDSASKEEKTVKVRQRKVVQHDDQQISEKVHSVLQNLF